MEVEYLYSFTLTLIFLNIRSPDRLPPDDPLVKDAEKSIEDLQPILDMSRINSSLIRGVRKCTRRLHKIIHKTKMAHNSQIIVQYQALKNGESIELLNRPRVLVFLDYCKGNGLAY